MEKTSTIHEAKFNLSKLAAAGGDHQYRRLWQTGSGAYRSFSGTVVGGTGESGFWLHEGKMVLHEGWDDPLPDDITDEFYSIP